MTDNYFEPKKYKSEDQARRASTMKPHGSLGHEEINQLFMKWGIIGKSRPIGPKQTYYHRNPVLSVRPERLASIHPRSIRGR
jgi:hypothetical protein